jgi:hypothetical protein
MSGENTERQTVRQSAEQTALQCFDNEQPERDKRLRQLASVFIDIFVASRTELHSPTGLVN